MTQALSIFRNDRNISSRTRAMVPACKTTTNSSGLIKIRSEKMNSPNKRIHFLQNSRSSRMYRYTANPPMISAIKISMADLLSDLNMLSRWAVDKVNRSGSAAMVSLHRLKDRLFRVPSFGKALENALMRNAADTRPIPYAPGLPVNRKVFSVLLIVRLFMSSCPAAIGRFVVSVIVDTIKRVTLRRLAHVGKKVSKIHPTLANGNPASAVSMVEFVSGAKTPILHFQPDPVKLGFRPAVGSFPVAGGFVSEAPARPSVIGLSQIAAINDCIASTVALGHPHRVGGWADKTAYDGETAKSLAGKIDDFRHSRMMSPSSVVVNNKNVMYCHG